MRFSMQRFRQNPRTAGRVVDGLAFVVTPDDNKLHTLNKPATRIWVLAERACTIDDAAAALVAGFFVEDPKTKERTDLDLGRARADAASFVSDLIARGILEPEPKPEPQTEPR